MLTSINMVVLLPINVSEKLVRELGLLRTAAYYHLRGRQTGEEWMGRVVPLLLQLCQCGSPAPIVGEGLGFPFCDQLAPRFILFLAPPRREQIQNAAGTAIGFHVTSLLYNAC